MHILPYTYEQYCAIYADYKRVKETIADLSEATVRVLEHAIRKTEAELYKMWFENYAVLKQRAALGMAASAEKRATSSGKTNFEAITAGTTELGRFLVPFRLLKRRGTRNFRSGIVAGARRRIATLARMSASGTIRNGGYPLKRIAGWRCEEETKTDRGGAFNSDCRDPACRLYAVERDSGSGTIFGRAYADYIPFPLLTLAPEPEEQEYIPDAAEVEALAKMLYGEARGIASDMEKAACVWCVLNRVDDPRFPDIRAGGFGSVRISSPDIRQIIPFFRSLRRWRLTC